MAYPKQPKQPKQPKTQSDQPPITLNARIADLYELLSDIGVNTDAWPVAFMVEPDCNPRFAMVAAEPHPYNEPGFIVLHGTIGPGLPQIVTAPRFTSLAAALRHFQDLYMGWDSTTARENNA